MIVKDTLITLVHFIEFLQGVITAHAIVQEDKEPPSTWLSIDTESQTT